MENPSNILLKSCIDSVKMYQQQELEQKKKLNEFNTEEEKTIISDEMYNKNFSSKMLLVLAELEDIEQTIEDLQYYIIYELQKQNNKPAEEIEEKTDNTETDDK